jgi:glycosyltransferase involved in cell wall biosynthesis
MEGTATVLPNALAAAPLVARGSAGNAGAELRAVTAGRLIGFKGTCLAMAAVRLAGNAGLTLDVYGAGPQRARLLRLRGSWGLAERVRFRGEVPRRELLSALAGAAVLVHPSLHEEAGFVVVEALAAGTPVVALDRGGPPEIARFFPDVPARMVKPSTPGRTARRMAAAIDSLIGSRGVPAAADGHFADGILAAYEAAGRASGD